MADPRAPFGGRPPESVLIVMLSALGDAVHVLPVANALKRAWPETRISWVIQPVAHQFVAHHAAIDEFFVFRRRRGLEAWRSYAELRAAWAGRTFDVALALQVYFKAGLITKMAPARVKLGFDRARARDLNWLFTTHRIPPHPVQHVQDQYFEFVRALGVDPEPVEWGLGPTEAERAEQRAFFERLDRPAASLVIGTSKPEKDWPAEHWARLADALYADFGLVPMLVGGPSAAERQRADRIRELAAAPVIDALGDGVRRLVWLLDGSRIVISGDTGPLHMAVALGKPLVGLYGYTNPRRTGPYRRPEAVVDGYARHPGEDYPPSMENRPGGMERVTVAAAIATVERELSR